MSKVEGISHLIQEVEVCIQDQRLKDTPVLLNLLEKEFSERKHFASLKKCVELTELIQENISSGIMKPKELRKIIRQIKDLNKKIYSPSVGVVS